MISINKTGDLEQIINEAAMQLKDCRFIIYCTDYGRFEEFSSKLHKSLPDAKMIGTTGFMFTADGSVGEGLTAIGFTNDEAEVYVGTLRKVDTCPIKYLPGLIWSVEEINNKYKDNICIEFSTGHEEKIVSTMKVSLEKVGMRLFGGTAGNVPEGQPKKVAANGKVLTDCTVYAVLGSKMGRIELYKDNMFHPRERYHIATKVSADNRTIIEIDEKKALDVYEEELGYTSATVEKGILKNPINRIVGAENYTTAIFSFNQDRTITTYKNVQKNDMICFADIDEDFRKNTSDSMEEITGGVDVAGILSINCILRYLFFEDEHYTSDFSKMMKNAANGNHWGVVGDGEQYNGQHINQSMVCAVFTRNK